MDIDVRHTPYAPAAGHGHTDSGPSAPMLDLGGGYRIFLTDDQVAALLKSGLRNWLTSSQRAELISGFIQ